MTCTCNCWTIGPECRIHRTVQINHAFNWVDYKQAIERDVALREIKFGIMGEPGFSALRPRVEALIESPGMRADDV